MLREFYYEGDIIATINVEYSPKIGDKVMFHSHIYVVNSVLFNLNKVVLEITLDDPDYSN